MKIRLPVLYCPQPCGRQLVNGIYRVVDTDTLLCFHCAGQRPPATVAAMHPDQAWLGASTGEPVDPADSTALLIRLGGEVVEEAEAPPAPVVTLVEDECPVIDTSDSTVAALRKILVQGRRPGLLLSTPTATDVRRYLQGRYDHLRDVLAGLVTSDLPEHGDEQRKVRVQLGEVRETATHLGVTLVD
jgi:hypothetical protein